MLPMFDYYVYDFGIEQLFAGLLIKKSCLGFSFHLNELIRKIWNVQGRLVILLKLSGSEIRIIGLILSSLSLFPWVTHKRLAILVFTLFYFKVD